MLPGEPFPSLPCSSPGQWERVSSPLYEAVPSKIFRFVYISLSHIALGNISLHHSHALFSIPFPQSFFKFERQNRCNALRVFCPPIPAMHRRSLHRPSFFLPTSFRLSGIFQNPQNHRNHSRHHSRSVIHPHHEFPNSPQFSLQAASIEFVALSFVATTRLLLNRSRVGALAESGQLSERLESIVSKLLIALDFDVFFGSSEF